MTNANLANPDFIAELRTLSSDPLRIARVAAAGGARVVGYVGNDIPVALLFAAGVTPVRLHGVAGAATPRADRFLESAHTPLLRSIVEQWLAGDLDFVHSVVFPRSDDSAQRAYYYLCELQRRGDTAGPRPLLHDVAGISRSTSVTHTRDSTHRLARELGVDEAQLASAAARVARRERTLAELGTRQSASQPLRGSTAWHVRRAAGVDWRESFDDVVHGALQIAPASTPASTPASATMRRVLLAGNAPPDSAIHAAIERAGGSVVLDLTDSESIDRLPPAATIDELADRCHAMRGPVLSMREDPEWIARRARAVGAHAVVLWLIEEDEAMPWEIARQERSLRAASMPTMRLVRQPWNADPATLNALAEFVSRVEMPR